MINVCGCWRYLLFFYSHLAFAAKNSGLLIAAVIDAWLDDEGYVMVTPAKVGCKSLDIIITSILSILVGVFLCMA